MKIVLLIAVILISGCSKEPISTEATNNPEVAVSQLFTHDGCTVYRFRDSGRDHYFTRCTGGSVQTSTAHLRSCGKGCTTTFYESNSTSELP